MENCHLILPTSWWHKRRIGIQGPFVLNFVAIHSMFVEIFQSGLFLPSLDPNCLCNGMNVALKNDEQNPTKFTI